MSSIERISLALVAAACIAGCDRNAGTQSESAAPSAPTAARITPQAESAAQVINGERIRSVIAELSDDRYGGRLPGTEGDLLARRYLAAELMRIGFAAGPDRSYEQPMELVGVEAQAPETWSFTRAGTTVDLARSTDFVASSGLQAP